MRFGRELRGGKGQEDYARNAHASELMEACWKGRKVQDVATLDKLGKKKNLFEGLANIQEAVTQGGWRGGKGLGLGVRTRSQ